MAVLQEWNLVLMLVIMMASFKLSEGCIPPPPPRCVGTPSDSQFTRRGEPCIFPFKYESKEYSECAEFDGFKYCATEINRDCTYKRLGICAGSGPSACPTSLRNKTKINGGVPVLNPDTLPFQVGIVISNTPGAAPFCGGSIVGLNWIVSAAHCTEGDHQWDPKLRAQDIQVLMGVKNWAQNNLIYNNIDYKIPHPQYIGNGIGYYDQTYDILMLWMRIPIPSNPPLPNINMVALHPPQAPIPTGQCIYVSGWGLQPPQMIQPQQLHFATVRAIANQQCQAVDPRLVLSARRMCTLSINPIIDGSICNGDSGGPLYDPVTAQLIGVVQSGLTIRLCQSPSIYIRVSDAAIHNFITGVMAGIPPGK